jgi:hypothetical protein
MATKGPILSEKKKKYLVSTPISLSGFEPQSPNIIAREVCGGLVVGLEMQVR